MKKHIQLLTIIPIALLAVLAIMTLLTWFWNQYIFIAFAALFVVSAFATIWISVRFQHHFYRYLQKISRSLNMTEQSVLNHFPLPTLVLGSDSKVVWYNDLFRQQVLLGRDVFGGKFSRLLPNLTVEDMVQKPISIKLEGRYYTVYGAKTEKENSLFYTLYFVDDTALKITYEEYQKSRPTVALAVIDNMEELLQTAKDSERAQIQGQIETILEHWIGKTTGFFRRLGNDRFLIVMEERHLAEAVKGRFSVLDRVREVTAGGRMSATLSIGVGRGGESFHECEEMARQALDMALGRGGDQVAVRRKDGYEFYGGVSKGVEKRTRVRSRISASALSELIDGSGNVLIMGHKGSDLDALGAAVGVYRAVVSRGKDARIVVNRKTSLAQSLLRRMDQENMSRALVEPEDALDLIDDQTLLIVVDTHRPDFLDSVDVYRRCEHVVVIDHHRKMVEHIDNAVIFFHEPFASSASEMVTELLQYMTNSGLGRFEAEALLAGIMLDTKDFVFRTGVRTFEAAAFLRRKGADTVAVKKMFAGSVDSYQKKAMMVTEAKIYRNCAISCSVLSGDDMRISAAQAADELLNIDGVDASFVLYSENNVVFISGRSMGLVNVQIIMESIGGGGHLTMAGAQLSGVGLEDARQQLLKAIDLYQENRAIESRRAEGKEG